MDEPLLNISYLNGLYQEFVEHQSDDYEELIKTYLDVLRNLRSKRSHSEQVCEKLEKMLIQEKNSWSLTWALYQNHLLNVSRIEQMDDNTIYRTESEIVAFLYSSNDDIRRMQVVADWLEANESNDLDERGEGLAEFYSEGTTPWENTFHKIKNPYIEVPPDLCTSMDPDGPLRTKKLLDHTDKEDEYRFFKHVFRFIRSGKLQEAHELAERVGYYWLSAMLDSWMVYEDPNELTDTVDDEVKPITGNKKRKIWKQTCFKAAQIHGLSSYEKAILGTLSANLKSILPVCHRWSDQLWARLRCSIDVLIEQAIEAERNDGPPFPDEFHSNYQEIREIFKSIDCQRLAYLSQEEIFHHTVQKYLVMNDLNGLLDQLVTWCVDLKPEDDEIDSRMPQFLRFFAHLVLMLRYLKLVKPEDPRMTKVLETYIGKFSILNTLDNITHFIVFLPKQSQARTFAKILSNITDKDKRRHMIDIAQEAQLDVDEITQAVVEQVGEECKLDQSIANISTNSSTQTQEKDQHELTIPITTRDKRKLDVLDYLLYPNRINYLALLHHCNALMRQFTLARKIDAVRISYSKLPSDIVNLVKNQWCESANRDITVELMNKLRECNCYKLLIKIHDQLAEWSATHQYKPKEPKKPANLIKFCDNIEYEQKIKEYEFDIGEWRNCYNQRTNSLVSSIHEMFLYEGGWMKNLQDQQSDSDQERLQNLKDIRSIYIPQSTLILLKVLYTSERYDECQTIAEILTTDDLKLYENFSKVQLRDCLDKIKEISIVILQKS